LSPSFAGVSYSAGLGVPAGFVFPKESPVLFVTGLLFDEIVFLDRRQYQEYGFVLLRQFWEVIKSLPQATTSVGSLVGTFTSNPRTFDFLFFDMLRLDREFAVASSGDPKDLIEAQEQRIATRVIGRNMFMTCKGHMGWGPSMSEVGDIIAVVAGCHVSLAIRRVHVEKLMNANLVITHDVNKCTQPACETEKQPFYRILGEAC
jgi:hypothetical protein